MAENNEEKDLKSSSSIESNETFEEKMAHIQGILNAQKNEIVARREGIEVEEAPVLAAQAPESLSDPDPLIDGTETAPETAEIAPVTFSEPESELERQMSSNPAEEVPEHESTNVDQAETQSGLKIEAETKIKDTEIEKITPLAEAVLPEMPINQPQQANLPATLTSARVTKKKSHTPVIAGIVVILLLAIVSIFFFQQKFQNNHPNTNQTSQSSESTQSSSTSSSSSESTTSSSSSSFSSSSSQSSTSSSSSAPSSTPSRANVIASVKPNNLVPLDPNITGQEAVFNWPAGLQSEVVAQAQADGKIGNTGFRFIPAQITGGDQGWMNLYDANGEFVLSVDLATGWIIP